MAKAKKVNTGDAGEAAAPLRVKLRKVRREECKSFLQDEVAKVLPEVVERAKAQVIRGDLGALKKLWDMSGLDKQTVREKRRRGSLGLALLRGLKREEAGAPPKAEERAVRNARPRSALGQFMKRDRAAE